MLAAVRFILLALAVAGLPSTWAQTAELFSAPTLRVSVNGVMMKGEREIEPAASGMSNTQLAALLKSVRRRVTSGETLQLKVELANAAGEWVDVTTNAAVRYDSLGCMTVSGVGLVSVVQSSDLCFERMRPELWIAMVDAQGRTTAWNRVFFTLN
jgi:hypothetical protein